MRNYYGALSPEPTETELRNRELARRAAAEGFVLLKNENGALPLTSKKIALYGAGARRTVKGGTGSGSLENRYSVNIEEGLKNAGYEITSGSWLDAYDREYEEAYAAWHDDVEAQVKDLTDRHDIIVTAHSYVFQCPDARAVLPADVEEDAADTAIYVLTRQAGEGHDRRLTVGDYYLTDIEKESLLLLARSYTHVITVVNVGGLIDFSFMDEIPGIDALVLYVQGGEEGGNALADVLSGNVNFSGKTAMTIPVKYEDIPFGDRFSYMAPDPDNSYYSEGIYVGYRYYDSFDVPVRYPFGFGLSYTSFEMKPEGIRIDDENGPAAILDVTVTNTGSRSGKEVVQAYVSVPAGASDKEYQRLASFVKTDEIAPGRTQKVTLTVKLSDLTSYDAVQAAWYLEAGDYIVRVGDSSRHTKPAAVLHLPERVVTEQCRNCQVPTDELPEFKPANVHGRQTDQNAAAAAAGDLKTAADADGTDPAGGADETPVLVIAPTLFVTRIVDYTEPETEEDPQVSEILNILSAEEQIGLLCGGGSYNELPEGVFDIAGAAGKTSIALLEKGIPDVIFADGPAGISVMSHMFAMPDGSFQAAEVPERYNWGLVGRQMAAQIGRLENAKTPHVYRYATAWPVAMLQAQTWNMRLMEEIGDAVGGEMEAFGITVWLAPGMNIQKNTLGGRTFEYYSEDPYLSGKMAAALTGGVQAHPGCGVSIKHFCCNNIEDNRLHISANVSERALREIYLKGFEIAVKEAQPMTVMSSYNLINHTYAPNSRDLLTDILRCEWGFSGMVMSDWGSCDEGLILFDGGTRTEHRGDPAKCVIAGNDLVMPGNQENYEKILAAYRNGEIDAAEIRRSAARVLKIVLDAQTSRLE